MARLIQGSHSKCDEKVLMTTLLNLVPEFFIVRPHHLTVVRRCAALITSPEPTALLHTWDDFAKPEQYFETGSARDYDIVTLIT